jgi:hypothetical protein
LHRAEEAVVNAGGDRAYLAVSTVDAGAMAFFRALGWSLSNEFDGTDCKTTSIAGSSIPAIFKGDDGTLYCRMTKQLS